jgi:hypothetical protein
LGFRISYIVASVCRPILEQEKESVGTFQVCRTVQARRRCLANYSFRPAPLFNALGNSKSHGCCNTHNGDNQQGHLMPTAHCAYQ